MEISPKSWWTLNPMDRASALLFGLFMALTFTCSISVASAHRVEIKELIIAALGCNMAWGLVDGALFLIDTWALKNRSKALLKTVQTSAESPIARKILSDALPPVIAAVMEDEKLEELRRKLIALPDHSTKVRLTVSDYKKSIETFLFTFISTFPIVIPFILIQDSIIALRTSNCIAITMMFLCGWSVGKYVGINKWKMSSAMVAVGVTLVIITVLLGG